LSKSNFSDTCIIFGIYWCLACSPFRSFFKFSPNNYLTILYFYLGGDLARFCSLKDNPSCGLYGIYIRSICMFQCYSRGLGQYIGKLIKVMLNLFQLVDCSMHIYVDCAVTTCKLASGNPCTNNACIS
jgi:hypothetical protein